MGLSETPELLPDPKIALDNLHQLVYSLRGEVNLLVYIVCDVPKSTHNYKLFHDILCRKRVPLIVIKATSTGIRGRGKRVIQSIQRIGPVPNSSDVLSALQCAIVDGIQPDETDVLNILQENARLSVKFDPMEEWFMTTAMRSWTLLGMEAAREEDVEWKLRSCYDALFDNLQRRERLSPDAAKDKCEEVKAYMKR